MFLLKHYNKGFEPETSCVRDQDANTEPARHRETESLS